MKRTALPQVLVAFLSLALVVPTMAGQRGAQDNNSNAGDSRRVQSQVAAGQKMKIEGTVVRRDGNSLLIKNTAGPEINVQISGSTKIEEKKGNPFRGAKKYTANQISRGLFVEVEGRGDGSGALVAEKIKFSNDAQRVALSIDQQITPVENRMGQDEARLAENEQNAKRLAGQLDELAQVANLAKGGAAAAQRTADQAVEGVNRTNDRITSLDDYQEKKSSTVNFRVGSAVLTPTAKASLDEIAADAKNEHGFVIEVRGFASSDGSANLNDRLSERRAQAVVRYLATQQEIPLRRIVLPFGYGKAMPVADNASHEGRQQNRRVEVKILVSRGLTSPVNVNSTASAGAGSGASEER